MCNSPTAGVFLRSVGGDELNVCVDFGRLDGTERATPKVQQPVAEMRVHAPPAGRRSLRVSRLHMRAAPDVSFGCVCLLAVCDVAWSCWCRCVSGCRCSRTAPSATSSWSAASSPTLSATTSSAYVARGNAHTHPCARRVQRQPRHLAFCQRGCVSAARKWPGGGGGCSGGLHPTLQELRQRAVAGVPCAVRRYPSSQGPCPCLCSSSTTLPFPLPWPPSPVTRRRPGQGCGVRYLHRPAGEAHRIVPAPHGGQ